MGAKKSGDTHETDNVDVLFSLGSIAKNALEPKEHVTSKIEQAIHVNNLMQIIKDEFHLPQELCGSSKNELSCENLQTVEGESFNKNVQSIQKKSVMTLHTIQEDVASGSSQSSEKDPLYENIHTLRARSSHMNIQPIQKKKSVVTLHAIQEDISNENLQALGKRSSRENVQAMGEESSHNNILQEYSCEKVETASEVLSQENNEDKEERSSQGTIQTVNEKPSRSNDELIQKKQPSDETNQKIQEESSDAQDIEIEVLRTHTDGDRDQRVEEISQENRCCTWLKKISVEPTMWLYMMAFMFTSVVEQAFFVYKACRVDHGYPEQICLNLNDHKDIKTEVQKTVSEFQQWYNIAGHIVPIILALFFGNWSDRRGRKLPLVIGLIGKFIYSFMVVVNTLMENWSLNMVTYTAVLPMGILGGDVMIFGSCFAYLTDICSIQERTMRITILDIVYLSTMPMGIALGSYVFVHVVNSSYTIMFAINACLLMLAIIYSLVRLKWQTSSEQQSLVGVNFLKDFFDVQHVKETVVMMIKQRSNDGRMCLILVMLSMCLYTFQREERSMSFLYTQLIFNWDVSMYSNFRTFQTCLFVIAMLGATPLMKHLKLKDTVIIIIGAISHASGRLLFIMAQTGQIFYGGAILAALGPVVAPALRSLASKLVSVEERGKVFAILSVFDNAVPLISSVLYSQIYNATIHTMPNFIYWLTFITQICVILLAVIINFAPWNLCVFNWYHRNNELLEPE